jgi:hypothetical protein
MGKVRNLIAPVRKQTTFQIAESPCLWIVESFQLPPTLEHTQPPVTATLTHAPDANFEEFDSMAHHLLIHGTLTLQHSRLRKSLDQPFRKGVLL